MNDFHRISFEDNPLLITFSDLETGKITQVNKSFLSQTGFTYEEVIGHNSIELGIIDEEQKKSMINSIAGKNELSCNEVLLHRKNKSDFWVNYYGKIVAIDNKPYYFSVAHDITPQKIYEKELEKQVSEKELILREVNHRIKNNLASVESLLSIEQSYSSSDETKRIIENSIGKLRSARIIYDKLLYSNNFNDIILNDYLKDLVRAIGKSRTPGKYIDISFQCEEEITMLPDNTFLIGLIVNELVTNSIKYAFHEKHEGTIVVNLATENNTLIITIKDDGIGMPLTNDKKSDNENGFGLSLVNMLAEQLKGTVTFSNTHGTSCIIKLPLSLETA